MINSTRILLTFSCTLLLAPPAEPAHEEDDKAIREAATKYAEAYSRGDIDALVAQYDEDAIYDEGEGPVLTGRDAIRAALAASLAESPNTRMTIEIESIRFTRGRAIEIGTATFTSAKNETTTVAYRAVHGKQPDGKWLLTHVGPDVTAEGATTAGPLDDLAWLLGEWKDDDANANLECTCRWDPNRRFLIRTFVVTEENRPSLEVTEIISWDAADRVVRSWVFDSDGGTGQNTWSKRGDEWIISARGTLNDGGRASAVNIIRRVDDNTFTWSSINRDIDGEMLPDIDNIKFVRASDTKPAVGGNN